MAHSRIEQIYLIDDSNDEVFMAKIFFKRQKIGASLRTFSNLEDLYDALQVGAGFDPNTALIVIDLNLTVCKGTEGVAYIRKLDIGPDVLVGISTGSEDSADRQLAEDVGADFFVGKPLNRDTLVDIVQAVPALSAQDEGDVLYLYRNHAD